MVFHKIVLERIPVVLDGEPNEHIVGCWPNRDLTAPKQLRKPSAHLL